MKITPIGINSMICLRCGYCCMRYSVVLPDGDYYDGLGNGCKFLTWDGDQAVCTIHGHSFIHGDITYRWEETPCGQFTQIDKNPTDVCRIGKGIREGKIHGIFRTNILPKGK